MRAESKRIKLKNMNWKPARDEKNNKKLNPFFGVCCYML
jgi:hypothetical protein